MGTVANTDRPVLLGMNNPLSPHPRHALYPDPPGCTGWRIWKMLESRTGATTEEYMWVFDRRNLLNNQAWDPVAARLRAPDVWRLLRGRRVLLLGAAVAATAPGCATAGRPPELVWQYHHGGDWLGQWCWVPHPSGRCRWYNDPVCREAMALRLEELYVGSGMAG